MRKHRGPYHDIGAAEYHQRFRERALQYLQKKAAKLGYTLSLASPIIRQPELFLSTRLFGKVPASCQPSPSVVRTPIGSPRSPGTGASEQSSGPVPLQS